MNKMEVWEIVDYEDSMGLFSTREKAEEALRKDTEEHTAYSNSEEYINHCKKLGVRHIPYECSWIIIKREIQ